MRYLFGFMCVLALGVMGCSETADTGGSGGAAGMGGDGGGGSAGTGGAGGNGGHGGSMVACVDEVLGNCTSPETVEPIVEMCEVIVPDQANACLGTESVVNPANCTPSGNKLRYKLTHMQVVSDCNTGYDLDGCQGSSCLVGDVAPFEGADGVDNALLMFDIFCISAKGEACEPIGIGVFDQVLHNAICGGEIDIEIEVDAGAGENCAVVTVTAGGMPGDAIPMNLSDDGCLSGTLGTIPIGLGGVEGAIENAVVRMTVSPEGFSDGILGGTMRVATAGPILDAYFDGAGAVAERFFDINADLSGNSLVYCDSLSATLDIGGDAMP